MPRFYSEIHRKKCPHTDENGVQCNGLPVYRKLKQVGERCHVKYLSLIYFR
jgi:hypothetical protein